MGARDRLQTDFLQTTGYDLEWGHRVRLIRNGAIFDALEEAIDAARQSVHLTVWIWGHGEATKQIVSALERASRRGVTCRLVVDGIGLRDPGDDFERLEKAHCQVRLYRKPFKVSLRLALERTHRKIAVIDGRVGFIGGFGIDDHWLGDGLSEHNWRDTHVRVEGPAVRQLQVGFVEVWRDAGGSLLSREEFPEFRAEGGCRAMFVRSETEIGRNDALELIHRLISQAERRLWLATAYFVPPAPLRKQLISLKELELDVRILMPGPFHDVRVAQIAQHSTYPDLLDAGIRLYEYQPAMLHEKVALVDDDLVAIGSINLDTLSLRHLQEGSLVVEDEALAAEVESAFLQDFAHSKEITERPHKGLRPAARLLHRVWHPKGMFRSI